MGMVDKILGIHMSPFPPISWYELVIRLVLGIGLWLLYREYLSFKENTDRRVRALNEKMRVSHSIFVRALNEFIEEGANSNEVIIGSLKKLGDDTIDLSQEDRRTTLVRDELNRSLVEKLSALDNIIDQHK